MIQLQTMIIDSKSFEKCIDIALENGADFAEIFIEDSTSQSLDLNDSAITGANSSQFQGAGIRLFYGLEEIYTYTNDLSEAGLIKAAQLAALALSGKSKISPQALRELQIESLQKYQLRPWELEGSKKATLLFRSDKAARTQSSLVSQVSASIRERNQKVQIVNSLGKNVSEERNYLRFITSAVAERDGHRENSHQIVSMQRGSEAFETLNIEDLSIAAAKEAVLLLDAKPAPAGEMPVVIDKGFGGVIFHEACGHGLETTSVAKNASVFCGLLDKKIAHDCVTAIDDGRIAESWGSIAIDDEGNPTQNTVLIEKGVLKSYLVDELGSRKTGYKITGSGRRESYRYSPTSRMRNTYIAAGSSTLDEMISDIDYGNFAHKMGGGSVSPGTGEYNFAVKHAYLIKDGKIQHPIRGASLVGKGIETLARIEKVGNELSLEGGMCGSSSGWVPVTSGQPAILVSKIQVGGTVK